MILLDISKVNSALFSGAVSTPQANGISAILMGCLTAGITLKEQIAYVLATAYHESGRHMQGISEYGHGAGHTYGQVDPNTHQAYYGRGIVQLTWKNNYEKFGQLVGVDLVHFPERANELAIAVKIMCVGMRTGGFTGESLNTCINQSQVDYIDARRIINGVDCANLIASYAVKFESCLSNQASQVA